MDLLIILVIAVAIFCPYIIPYVLGGIALVGVLALSCASLFYMCYAVVGGGYLLAEMLWKIAVDYVKKK